MILEDKQKGFTLVELLIATTVFAIIMLISTYGFLWINHYYTKGIAMARTQDAARNILADVSGQIQLTSGEVPPPAPGRVCIGNKDYVYSLNTPETGSGSALYSANISSGGCGGTETDKKVLLAKNTRVIEFSVTELGINLYTITITLLNAPKEDASLAGTDLIDTGPNPSNYSAWRCKSGVGGEFCSLTKVSTTVYRRVQ
jgi:prepilin-type N-terminal cleavage/methylation domain-containing protein